MEKQIDLMLKDRRMKHFLFVIVLVSSSMFAGISAAGGGKPKAPPLVDGSCDEYTSLGAESVPLSSDVVLRIYQDKFFVWMCYGYPEGSFGTLDLTLTTSTLKEGLNLHASAQLGEWPADKPDLAPTSPESELWWNIHGWTANPVWINGMDNTSDKPRYRFKNAKARELQPNKQRFGSGVWRFKLEIRNIKGTDGRQYDIAFPKDGTQYLLKVS
jgi:hypothetical protein